MLLTSPDHPAITPPIPKEPTDNRDSHANRFSKGREDSTAVQTVNVGDFDERTAMVAMVDGVRCD